MSTQPQPLEPGRDEPPEELQPIVPAAPVSTRNAPLTLLSLMAFVVFLRWAQAVLIPITFAVLFSYALTPVVNALKRNAKLHKALGAALILGLILGGVGGGLNSLQPEALDILDIVPRATQKISVAMRTDPHAPTGALAIIQRAVSEIEKTANSPASSASSAVAVPRFRIRNYLVTGTVDVAAGIGQLVVVVALVYFLLIAGDTFRRALLRVSGDSLTKKKITIQMLDEIDSQIQRYLLVQLATSALLGLLAYLVFAWVGLDNALTWGCVGSVLHLIPYAGPAAFVALIALVAYVQFDTLQPVLVILGSLLASLGVIALLLVPWLTQKVGSLNAVAVFLTLLVWGWLWGIWGLLLGVPIMMAVHTVCERFEHLQAIGAFLGRSKR
jgi:predicted PurR-regulated permease PerM